MEPFMVGEKPSALVCGRCVFFRPHDVYEYMGYCTKKGLLVTADNRPCSDYKEASVEDLKKVLEERGWLYCASCKEPIYDVDDLMKHAAHLHYQDTFSDEVATEEAPAAD